MLDSVGFDCSRDSSATGVGFVAETLLILGEVCSLGSMACGIDTYEEKGACVNH